MTRTEAIEIIKREFSMDEDVEKLYPEVVEAREMAISALEQDCDKCEYANPCLYCKHEFSLTSTDEPMTMVYPTIFCEDAISRKDAINAIATDYITAVRNLESLPSVQPSHKGHWIDVSNFVYECSNCGGRGMFRELFCPNCGADMRGAE